MMESYCLGKGGSIHSGMDGFIFVCWRLEKIKHFINQWKIPLKIQALIESKAYLHSFALDRKEIKQ